MKTRKWKWERGRGSTVWPHRLSQVAVQASIWAMRLLTRWFKPYTWSRTTKCCDSLKDITKHFCHKALDKRTSLSRDWHGVPYGEISINYQIFCLPEKRSVMASRDLGFNDSKLAWGNWDYVDLSHFTKMPGNPITASALALMKECGAKAQHPGVLAGVASFSAGIALHRMRRSHCKRPNECIDIVSPPAQDLCKDEKVERSWLPVVLKSAGAACLILAVSRKVRKRCKTVLAAKTIQLDVPVNSTVHLEASAKADEAIFSEACELGNGKVQDSIQSDSTKAPSSTKDSTCTASTNSTISSCRSGRGTTPDRSFRQSKRPVIALPYQFMCRM